VVRRRPEAILRRMTSSHDMSGLLRVLLSCERDNAAARTSIVEIIELAALRAGFGAEK
jgi:predicted acetyltransferase